MENSKFKLSAREIEISGDPEFVNSQIENFKELIFESYRKMLQETATENYKSQEAARKLLIHSDSTPSVGEMTEYVEVKEDTISFENVLVVDNDRIKVICDVPGNNTARRMINFILI